MTRQKANTRMAHGPRIVVAFALAAGCAMAQAEDAGTRYAKLLADAESYTHYNGQIEQQIKTQASELAEVQAQVAQLDATGAEVPALLQKMFEQLDAFVAK